MNVLSGEFNEETVIILTAKKKNKTTNQPTPNPTNQTEKANIGGFFFSSPLHYQRTMSEGAVKFFCSNVGRKKKKKKKTLKKITV